MLCDRIRVLTRKCSLQRLHRILNTRVGLPIHRAPLISKLDSALRQRRRIATHEVLPRLIGEPSGLPLVILMDRCRHLLKQFTHLVCLILRNVCRRDRIRSQRLIDRVLRFVNRRVNHDHYRSILGFPFSGENRLAASRSHCRNHHGQQ